MENAVSRLRRRLFEEWERDNGIPESAVSELHWQIWLAAWEACENKFKEARDA